MRARAAVTAARGAPFVVVDVDLEPPRADEVLVRVQAAGVCHTDSAVRDQWYPVPLPAVLGHEGAGVVEAVGDAVRKVAPGDRVAMSYGSCGLCAGCQTGRPWLCTDFWGRNFGAARPDGSTALSRQGSVVHSHFFSQSSFASHAIATERNVVKLDADVPFELAAPLGCGVQTGAGAVLNALRPPAGSSVAVFGTGTVGLAAVLAAQIAGCTMVVGVDVRTSRLEAARDLGATHVIDPRATDPVQAVLELTSGAGVDFSLDTTGSSSVLPQAIYCLRSGGVCGLIGGPPLGTEVLLDINEVLTRGRTLRGIVEGESVPDTFLPRLIELWRGGRFPIDRIMTPYAFDDIEQAARDAEAGLVIKPVLTMTHGGR